MKQYVFPKSLLMDTRLKYREVVIQSRKMSRVLRQVKSIIFHSRKNLQVPEVLTIKKNWTSL